MDAVRGVSEAGLSGLVERSGVGLDAALDAVAARARLLWRVQGELLAELADAVAEAVAAEPPRGDADEQRLVGAVGELVGWTVHWTSGYARGQVELAVGLARRLPMVLAALREGQIDQAKAAAFVDALACVDDEVAVRIAARLLPKARTWTLTELRAALRYHVDRADPGAARRRYRRRVAERDVSLQAQPDGTATLSGQGLAPHRAAAAFDRVDRLARAARAGGDVRTLAQLRADAMCDVLAGVPFQLAPAADPLCAQADAAAPTWPERCWHLPDWRTDPRFPTRGRGDNDPDDGPSGGGGGDPGGPDGPDGDGPDGGGDGTGIIDLYDYDRACLTDEDRAWVDLGWQPPGADDETPDWWPACHPTRTAAGHQEPPQSGRPPAGVPAADSRSENRTPRDPDSCSENRMPPCDPDSCSENRILGVDPEDRVWAAAQADALHLRSVLSADVLPADRCACGGRLCGIHPGTVDVQITLTTLAGIDDHPALIPGLGVTLAPIARQIATDPHTRPTWRWSVFNDRGELLHHGLTRQRPTNSRSQNAKTEQVRPDQPAPRLCTCPRLEPGLRRGSVELQLTPATLHELLTNPQLAPGWHPVLTDIATQIEHDQNTNPPDPLTRTRRMPDASDDAYIRARDRSCRTPHCSVPANRCELDHRIEHAKGGPSHPGNVDARCRRHHQQRHRRNLTITKTGHTTTWTIPSGRTFTVTTDKDLILTRED